MQNNRKTIHPQLILLTIIFIFPIIISWILYHYHDYFQLKTSNCGILLNPPIHIEYLQHTHQKKWQIIYVTDGNCNAACQQMKHQLHQVQKALGNNRNRINIMLLDNKKLPQTLLSHDKIYLADPIGNLFMYYPNTTDPLNILKDIKRVLEVSQIG